MLLCFQHHPGRTQDRLGRKRQGGVARQAHPHSAVGESLDHHVHERRPAAAQAGHRVEQGFRQRERLADRVEQFLDQGRVFRPCAGPGGEPGCALADQARRVRHDADEPMIRQQPVGQLLERDPGRDRDDDMPRR